ncbi:hypothetical protein ACL02R_07220 [Streptomyces sp. MS19]|uniref:hypothetical protein n=1 Tax=Streptomyces sp. MS19 TaxID=3385972 RepID=UPI0039A30B81
MDTNETLDAARLREAMGRAVGDLEAAPELVTAALVLGPRRRARARALRAGGAVAATAAAVVAVALVTGAGPRPAAGGGTDVAAVPPAVASPTSTPSPADTSAETVPPDASAGAGQPRFPVVPGSTETPEDAALTTAERARVDDFRQGVARALEITLRGKAGAIQIVSQPVELYQGVTEDGHTFDLVFSVRPLTGGADVAGDLGVCRADETADVCRETQLPDGTSAAVRGLNAEALRTHGASVSFRVGDSAVLLAAPPDAAGSTDSPVRTEDLLRLAEDPRATELFHEADAQPVQDPA